MSIVTWLILSAVTLNAFLMWSIYKVEVLFVDLEEMSLKEYKRINDMLEKCLELKEKMKHDK